MTENLCQRYTSLTPFQVRREKAGEVFLLIRRINEKNARVKGIRSDDTTYVDSQGRTHIRRKALNDDWW